VPDIAFVHHRTGALLAGTFDQSTPPDHGFTKARHIHRADLHALLLGAVRAHDPDAVVTNARLTGIEDTSTAVTAHFADATHTTTDALIAADGVRSVARNICFGGDAPPFAGQIAFRCLIPRAIAAPYLGAGNAVVSVGAARIFNRYLIRGGALVNVIGIARTTSWAQEGWSTPATIPEFAATFEGFHEDVQNLIQCAPSKTLIKWGLFARPRAEHWSRGRVLLIGDAAHPMLPFLGLGAATAIEDGIVIARAFSAGRNVEAVFDIFRRTRAARVEAVRAASVLQGEIIQASDPDRAGLTSAPSQDATLFDYDPGSIPLAA
jgi:salicylate hydroxylase